MINAIQFHRSPGRKNRRPCRSGVTTVEFALVVPIILTMFVGAIELTRLNFLRHTAANAAYEGARAASVLGGTATNARAEARLILESVLAANGVIIDVQETTSRVTVTVNIPVNRNSWGLGRFTSGQNIIQSCSLARESVD